MGILVMDMNHGISAQQSEVLMNELIALAAPCDLSTVEFCWTFDPSSLNFCRISFSRRPSWGASTVMKSPLIPRASAFLQSVQEPVSR